MSKNQLTVFLGPSCTVEEAKTYLPIADYLPPAARVSFYNIINDDYHTIILVDLRWNVERAVAESILDEQSGPSDAYLRSTRRPWH
ncbi:MAG: hypothetical protein HOL77_14915 [Rhodobacteraceae bacterium]|nr:hypothetical protein [Paracoccaceae bacterium]